MSVRQNQSYVWQYYSRLKDSTAKCIKCKKILVCKRWSTSGLSCHLQTKYEIFENKCEIEEPPQKKRKSEQNISTFFKKEPDTLEEIVFKTCC